MLSPYATKTPSAQAAAVIVITIEPLDRRGRYQVHLGGRLLLSSSRQPLLDGARELIRLGADPDALIVMRRAGSSTDCLRGRIGTAAGLTVDESGSPRFKRWKPFPSGAVEAPAGQKAPAYAEAREGARERVGAEVAP
jgi:hypothetical protein